MKRFWYAAALAPAGVGLLMATMGATAAAAKGPHIGGSISINASPHGPWARVFNPYAPGENQDDIVGDIYEPLIEFNGNTGASKPWLATSWKWSGGNKVLTMNLRKGVKFTNGMPFTSQDVVFTLNMLKKYPAVDTSALWSYMKSVKAVGPHAVQITLTQPNSTFLYYLGGTIIVPAKLWAHVNPVTFPDSNPIGTGPYMLKSFSPQEIVLTRNPHWWQPGRPYLKTVYYPAETSNDSDILALARGQLDWASFFSPDLQKSFVSRNPKTNHVDVTSGGLDWLQVNIHKYPLNMPVVRQAISDAINRHALSVIAESGYSTPAKLDGIEATMQKKWATPALTKLATPTYSPAKAKALLLHHGFKKGPNGTLLTPKGKPFTVNLVVASSFTDFVTMSSQIKSMLGAIGIQATVNETSVSNFMNSIEDGKFDLGVMWGPSGPNPFYTLNPLLNTAYSAPVGKPAADNYERYSNPRIQTLAQQYERTTSVAVHKRVINQMGRILATQMPVIGLLNRNSPNEYSTAHIAGWPTKANPYWDNSSDVGPIVVLSRLWYK